MSVTDLPTRTNAIDSPPALAGGNRDTWVRVGLACAVLVASGAVRAWQADRISRELERGLESPLKLAAVPTELGPWKGEATTIDPQIALATGAKQVVTRRYVNQNTGVAIDVILLFGPAESMYLHRPELCYPSAGYVLKAGPEDKAIPAGPKHAAAFRSLVYSKGEGAQSESVEVYYTWRYNGRWTPDVGKQKQFERISGMYKVHVARRLTDRERRDVANPNEAFLESLVTEMERQMSLRTSSTS
jgi:hypothetical protein